MKSIGYLLLVVGFLAAALTAVQNDANQVAWNLYLPFLFLGIAGVGLNRATAGRKARHPPSLEANFRALDTALDRIVANLHRLDQAQAFLDVYAVHERIDELFVEDLAAFADARGCLVHLHGLGTYAEVMNAFAAGERYLNRVWSASVDGYIDEVEQYLERAREQFDEARQRLSSAAG